jgi:hypothetical protein
MFAQIPPSRAYEYIVTFLAGSGVFALLERTLLPKLIDHALSRRFEQFKVDLRAIAFERETRFAWFHTERAKAIMELYRRVADVKTAGHLLAEAASLGQDQSELRTNLRRTLVLLLRHANRTQIYLDKAIRYNLQQFMLTAEDAGWTLKNATSVFDSSFKEWMKLNDTLSALLEEIEQSFLGALNSQSTTTVAAL